MNAIRQRLDAADNIQHLAQREIDRLLGQVVRLEHLAGVSRMEMVSPGTASPSNLTLCSAVTLVSLRRFFSEKRTPSAVFLRLLNV